MKLFLISQTQNDSYDTFDSAVVIAADEDTARNMHPRTGGRIVLWGELFRDWCSAPEYVEVTYLGGSVETASRVVCASFNAG